MTLHDWLYQVVAEVCYDRDYLYLAFVRHFSALMGQIVERGRFEDRGTYALPGMKSNRSARLEWRLEHALTWDGPNRLELRCILLDALSGAPIEARSACFDLSTGEGAMPVG
jgi:hypothetical protein